MKAKRKQEKKKKKKRSQRENKEGKVEDEHMRAVTWVWRTVEEKGG